MEASPVRPALIGSRGPLDSSAVTSQADDDVTKR